MRWREDKLFFDIKSKNERERNVYRGKKSWGGIEVEGKKAQSPRENLKLSSLRHSRRIYRYNNLDGFILFSQFPLSLLSPQLHVQFQIIVPAIKTVYDGVYI